MKKTLVALAAIAATGGAFAQATMTGAVGFGWSQTVSTAGATASGFGGWDNRLDFAISEDLDGGAKITASTGINMGTASGSASASRDISLSIKTAGMGTFSLKNNKGGDYLSGGVAAVGSNYEADLTGTSGIFSTRAEVDNIGWSMPLTSEMTISATYSEGVDDAGAGAGVAGTAANTGDYQRNIQYSLTYKAGPLVADVGYRTFDQANAATANSDNRTRASVSYDLGVVKLGTGFSQTKTTYGATSTDTLVGVALPMGKFTLYGQLGNRTKSGNASASSDTNYSGQLYTAVYNLSKRTDLLTYYKTWDVSSSATSKPSEMSVVMYHYF